MDGRPPRGSQPADRRVINNSQEVPAYRPPEEPQSPQPVQQTVSVEPQPQPVHRTTTTQHVPKEKKKVKKARLPIIVAIIVVILVVVGYFAISNLKNAGTAINKSEYQAVFFTNGQVYFGKLQAFNGDYMKLTNIYYLQTTASDSTTSSTNPQQTSTSDSNVQLIKLGEEIHGPEDEMIISKDQVLFYENLKPDGKVAQSIAKYKAAK